MTEEKRNKLEERLVKKSADIAETKPALRIKRVKKKKNVEEQAKPKTRKWVQIRLLPIWLRVILVLLLLVVAAVVGAMFGYGYLGEGSPGDVLKKETWMHIWDIVKGHSPKEIDK